MSLIKRWVEPWHYRALAFLTVWVVELMIIFAFGSSARPIYADATSALLYIVAFIVPYGGAKWGHVRFGQKALVVSCHIVAMVLVICISDKVAFVAEEVAWDPIDQTGFGFSCQTVDSGAVGNGKGDVAVVRELWCKGDEGYLYFVFVHAAGESNTRQNLVFRYAPTVEHVGEKPMVTWTSSSSLKVVVGQGVILQVSKQLNTIGDITVNYQLGAAACPPVFTWQQRAFGPLCNS